MSIRLKGENGPRISTRAAPVSIEIGRRTAQVHRLAAPAPSGRTFFAAEAGARCKGHVTLNLTFQEWTRVAFASGKYQEASLTAEIVCVGQGMLPAAQPARLLTKKCSKAIGSSWGAATYDLRHMHALAAVGTVQSHEVPATYMAKSPVPVGPMAPGCMVALAAEATDRCISHRLDSAAFIVHRSFWFRRAEPGAAQQSVRPHGLRDTLRIEGFRESQRAE
jgi:hypothetical protein